MKQNLRGSLNNKHICGMDMFGNRILQEPACTTLQELNGHYIVLWQHIADASPGHLGNMMLSTSQDLNPIDPNRSKHFVN